MLFIVYLGKSVRMSTVSKAAFTSAQYVARQQVARNKLLIARNISLEATSTHPIKLMLKIGSIHTERVYARASTRVN